MHFIILNNILLNTESETAMYIMSLLTLTQYIIEKVYFQNILERTDDNYKMKF